MSQRIRVATAYGGRLLSAYSTIMLKPGRRRVFIVGLPKTGTTSLEQALGQAGINLMRSPRNLCLLPMLRQGKYDILKLPHMAGYDGTTEMIGAIYFQHLLRQYPDAYFIYTTRETKSWLQSAESYWSNFAIVEGEYVFLPMGRGALDSDQLSFAVKALFGCLQFDKPRFAAAYTAHRKSVFTCFREARHFMHLPLELSDTEKASRLSKFVGRVITGYPHANAQPQRMQPIR